MTIETVGAIFLGWLLGLLSPLIVDAIRKHNREKEVREGIYTELRDLRLCMALAAYMFEIRFGTYDREFLNWIIPILKNYKGLIDTKQLPDIMETHVALDDKALLEIAERQKAQPGAGLIVKKYRIPYIDSQIGELGIFDEQSRSAMLEVRAQLDLYNEDIDEARQYYRMTFDLSGSDSNHSIACNNLDTCYKNLAQKAKHIVNSIELVLPS